MDEVLGWCRGCGRANDEIAEWAFAENSRREAIWALLPKRVGALGIAVTRLPWRHGRIAEFVAESLDKKTGTWAVGCYGAGAEFGCAHDEPCGISISGNKITALSERGGLQLTIDENVRALRLCADHASGGYCGIFLTVVNARANLPVTTSLTPLGRDEGAIRPDGRSEHWFDIGLGRADLRFGMRTADNELRKWLNQASGLPLTDLLQAAGSMILTHCPARIVESPIGRAEIFPSNPRPGEQLTTGPHCHLSPEPLASGRSTPPGIDLPPVYALGAAFCPRLVGAGADFWPYGHLK